MNSNVIYIIDDVLEPQIEPEELEIEHGLASEALLIESGRN